MEQLVLSIADLKEKKSKKVKITRVNATNYIL